MKPLERLITVVVAAALLAFALTACGGGGSSSSGSASTANTTTEGEGGGSALLAEAEEEVANYLGSPSEFPVTEKLKEVPTGAKVAMLVPGSPTGELIASQVEKAGKVMGVDITTVKAGNSAASAASAADSVVAMEPEAVINLAVPVELIGKQLQELKDKGIPLVMQGVLHAQQYTEVPQLFTENFNEVTARLVADYVATQFGTESNVVVFSVPELEFTKIAAESFTTRLEEICPTCTVQTEGITQEEAGSTAPDHVVSYLQANPDTNVTVFTAGELMSGVPSALEKAGLSVKSIGWTGTPQQLQYIKEGKSDAVLALDLAIAAWQTMDQTAREIVGQKLSGLESEGLVDMQILQKQDITFDPSKGWTGYPDFEKRFEELWGVNR